MSKIIRYILLCTLLSGSLLIGGASISVAAPPLQDLGAATTVMHDHTGYYSFIGLDTTARGTALPGATALQAGQPTAATALADLTVYAAYFGLDNPAQELQLKSSFETPGSSMTFRYQQMYQGVPILAGEVLANYDAAGRLSALVGETSPKLALSTTPTVAAETAAQLALEYVARASETSAAELAASPPELWIYDPRLLEPSDFPARLVWRTEVTPVEGHLPIRYLVLVDAQLPTVALAFNQIDTLWGEHAAAHAAAPQDRPAVSTANLPALAPNFANPPGTTYNSNFTPKRPGTTVCSTPSTTLTGPGSCDKGAVVSAANMAHYFAYDTANYFDLHHQRNSIDNKGMKLISHVNYRQNAAVPYNNAFWDGLQMTYGDADIFTVDDVVAHELTHGVTERSSNLFYYYESGAINESMSDVFGEFVDQANGINSFGGAELPAANWAMGEDMNAGALRNMANPPLFSNPDSTQSAIYWTGTGDNGGVHINSGISNKAAYLMAAGGTFGGYTITALGNNKTSAIYYEVNTKLLTSGADFQMLGAALVQACHNLRAGTNPLNITAADCVEVDEAMRAVGMHLDPVNATFAPSAPLCPTAGQFPVYVFKDDFENGLGNFVDGPYTWSFQTTSQTFGQPYATSGTGSMFGVNHPAAFGLYFPNPYLGYAEMRNAVIVPAGGYLYFNHAVAMEPSWDGALLEYSQNGAAWQNAGPLFSAGKNYDGALPTTFGNPKGGQQAFNQPSRGFVSSRYNLSSLAGSSVKFRWVVAADNIGSIWGWFIDDVQIYSCAAQPDIAVEAPGGISLAPTTTYDMGKTSLGTAITQTFTVRNTGGANLFFTNVVAPTGFSAAYTAATVAPGGSTTFNLTCLATAGGSPVKGVVTVGSNDPDESPFAFNVSCSVLASPASAAPVRNRFTTTVVPLSWNRITWAVDYEVQISRSSSFAGAFTVPVDPPTALTVNTPPLTVDGLYYWRVRAQRANGTWGAWSAADTFYLDLP